VTNDDDKARATEILEAMNRLTVDPAVYIARCLGQARAEGYQAGFKEARRCAADIAEMEAEYYSGSKHISDRMRHAVSENIMNLIKGLKPELSYHEQELVFGIKSPTFTDQPDYNPAPPKATYTTLDRKRLSGNGVLEQ
jgi:hypothetical protein